MLIHVGGKQEKNPLKDSWDASGFFHDKPSPFPMSNGGNWPLCLYEAVSGRNAGFSQRGDGRGKSMITPTPFRFMVKTEGLLWMHVRGLVEHRPSTPGLPRQMFSRTAPRYSLHPSLSFSSVCLSPSYGKVSLVGSPVKFLHSTLCVHFNLHFFWTGAAVLCDFKFLLKLILRIALSLNLHTQPRPIDRESSGSQRRWW